MSKIRRTMMAQYVKLGVAIVLLLLGAGLPHASAANAKQEADKLVQEGVALRRRGNDDAALPKFQSANALAPTPRNAAQLGLCEQAVGRWAEAEKHLSQALDDGEDPWVAKNLAVLRESLEATKANLVRLEFVGGPEGALVKVNGQEVGNLPLATPVKANAGQVHLQVTADGYSRWSSTLTLAGGHYQRVVVDATKLATPVPTAETTQPLPAAADNSMADVKAVAGPSEAAESSSRTWLWVGAAAVVVGAVATVLLLSSGGGSEGGGSCPAGVDVCASRN